MVGGLPSVPGGRGADTAFLPAPAQNTRMPPGPKRYSGFFGQKRHCPGRNPRFQGRQPRIPEHQNTICDKLVFWIFDAKTPLLGIGAASCSLFSIVSPWEPPALPLPSGRGLAYEMEERAIVPTRVADALYLPAASVYSVAVIRSTGPVSLFLGGSIMVNHRFRTSLILSLAVAVLLPVSLAHSAWKPAEGPLMTRWAKDVSPENVHPEYPRPQMVRRDWLNLNGLWDYAIRPRRARPDEFDGQILVPFPIESALSGVMKPVGPDNRLWYRRDVHRAPEMGLLGREEAPPAALRGRGLGRHRLGQRQGSRQPQRRLRPVHVRHHCRRRLKEAASRRSSYPSGTRPTPAPSRAASRSSSRTASGTPPSPGIWQTVWLEPVPLAYIASLEMTPDIDASPQAQGARQGRSFTQYQANSLRPAWWAIRLKQPCSARLRRRNDRSKNWRSPCPIRGSGRRIASPVRSFWSRHEIELVGTSWERACTEPI
jgi:hypothetical protein